MMKTTKKFVALAAALSFGATMALAGSALAGAPISDRGVDPTAYPGNFVSTDDQQVCHDLAKILTIPLEYQVDWQGFKIDPPQNYDDDFVEFTIYEKGKYLSWEIIDESAKMLAVIVKGGPNYNVYNYIPYDYAYDSGLGAPINKSNYPAISHYNVCYWPYPDMEGDQGCTPGYWRNHADRWVGVLPTDDFDDTFGVNLFDPNITLGKAIWLGGGGVNAFARHATAALLNAFAAEEEDDYGQTVNYPYTVAEVIQWVQDAVANGTIEATKNLFEAANELGCPLSGTPADPVEP
jgi:hypothetical protein